MFTSISPELQAAFARASQVVTLGPGVMLFSQDEPADAFFIVESGEIEISAMSASGRKLSLEIVLVGEIFGEIGLFAGRRTASATALGHVRLRVIRRADLLASLKSEPELALEIIDLLCERLRAVSEKLEERAFLPLPTRLARRILHLDAKLVASAGAIPVSQADLADFAGATREAVAKILAQWRRRGWIVLTRGAVRVVERSALVALAESEDM